MLLHRQAKQPPQKTHNLSALLIWHPPCTLWQVALRHQATGMGGILQPNSPNRNYIYASRDRIDEVNDRRRAVRNARFKYIRSYRPEVPGGHAWPIATT